MASTSGGVGSSTGADEEPQEEEEFERFDDFTLASSWERFISEIEAVCRQWLANGPKNLLEKDAVRVKVSQDLFKVKCELKYAGKSYTMEYYFEGSGAGKIEDWDSSLHELQLCFGVKEFLVIAPQSANGVVLDAPEASKLLSAVAIALTNCCSLWPAFVPVHVPSRKAYIGIQNLGTVFTRRFEADHIGSQVPVKYMHLGGLYELFVSKFAYSSLDLAMHLPKVHFKMKSTYRTAPFNDEDDDPIITDADNKEPAENFGSEMRNGHQWDDDCPWSEWYSAEDPVKGFELIATWSEKIVESSLEMEEMENASPREAEAWTVLPVFSHSLHGSDADRVGFASQLLLLVDALAMSYEAQFMEDFVSVESPNPDNIKSSMVVPPPTVLDRVLKDLFQGGSQFPDNGKSDHKDSRAIKGTPHGSLFARFCLHCLWMGNCNIRAIAVLWIEFIREVRWCWEESQPLPKMLSGCSIDLTTCLINQKLQMLATCIEKKCEMNEEFEDCIGSSDDSDPKEERLRDQINHKEVPHGNFDRIPDSTLSQNSLHGSERKELQPSKSHVDVVPGNQRASSIIRRGSAGEVGLMLLKSHQSMHAPYTQDAPLMTEDMHEERLQAVEASGGSFNFSAQLERDILLSDMSAFKAANPDAIFEDFIRWHSPGDWENDESKEAEQSKSSMLNGLQDNWPPRGRLSKRMSERGNLWRKIWNEAPAVPASEQKPLLDPVKQGEKVLHYLETLRPHELLEQMVCTAFKASADTLNQTSFGGFKQMRVKLEQLYLTMASTLRPLKVNTASVNSETLEDFRRLCVIFEHIEKLLALAASLHRKLMQASRLSEAIFTDYYNFYLPKMGTGSVDAHQQEFDKKYRVRMRERPSIASMFTLPSESHSWRKEGISMGNLFNGHEPIVREIMFSVRDSLSNNYHTVDPTSFRGETETYRMYICGTPNDLRVALSVTSCD